MARNVGREVDSETYSPTYIKNILAALGLRYEHESEDQLTMLCPWHEDSTPSFTINLRSGLYHCFVPSCSKSGTILDMVKDYGKFNNFEALRFMAKAKPKQADLFYDQLADLLKEEEEFVQFDSNKLYELREGLSEKAIDYMATRGINKETLLEFGVGYSEKMGMVSIPCYSHTNVPVGIIGRSIEGKRFKYSKNMPIARVWFNLQSAKRKGGTVVIVEASFDALRVAQAGFPNVVAILGGNVSKYKMELLNKYFDRVIIMTDNDEVRKYDTCNSKKCADSSVCLGHSPGRDAGDAISKGFVREVFWACQDANIIYPHNAKDAGDLTDSEIRSVIENAMPDSEYRQYHGSLIQ